MVLSNPQHFSIAMLSQRTSKPCWLLWPIKRPQKTTLQSHLASSPKSPKIPRPAIGRVATEIHFPFWSMRTKAIWGSGLLAFAEAAGRSWWIFVMCRRCLSCHRIWKRLNQAIQNTTEKTLAFLFHFSWYILKKTSFQLFLVYSFRSFNFGSAPIYLLSSPSFGSPLALNVGILMSRFWWYSGT